MAGRSSRWISTGRAWTRSPAPPTRRVSPTTSRPSSGRWLIWGFQTFEIPQIITGGGPHSSTELVSLRIYSTTFRSLRFGLGAAMAYSVALLLLVPAVIYIRKAHKSIVEM